MQYEWNNMGLAIFLLAMLLAGCGGGTELAKQQQSGNGTLAGSITVGGSELAELPGSGKIGTRLIENIEDIDSIEIETTGGLMNVTSVPPGTAQLLQLALMPEEDLSGGNAASTAVTLNIPLSIEQGQRTSVSVEVQFEQEAALASKAASQAGRPWFVRLRYTISGPGATTRHLRIRWADSMLQDDRDLDDDFSDEDSFPDSDRDGLGDDYREIVTDQAKDRAVLTREGSIMQTVPAEHAVLLNTGLSIRISELTSITRNGQPARPAELQPGDACTASGYIGDDGILRALEIDARAQSDVSSRH